MEQVTIRDIARKCKVGVSTVSRAMNNHPDINPETKEMILKVIAESNYVPNNSARNLKRSNAKAIAILVKGMDNMFFNNMISVIEEVVRKKKYACIIERVEEKANEVDSAIEIVKEKRLRGIIFLGGVQRLAAVTEKIVPIMAAIFLLGGLVVLIFRIRYVPATFGMIFKYAFEPQAIVGGSFGYAIKQAISQGAKRGLFSNEAGMGSTPHAHAQANVKDPHEQGVVAMVGVFIDTFVVLTLNALVIICTLYTADGPLANGYVGDVTSVLSKTNLAQTAFGSVMGASLGAKFVAICLFFFAFSTVLSWNLFGKINAIWLFGKKNPKACTVIYTLIALVFILMGTMMSNDLVWELTDMFNNLMVIPNAIALLALTSHVVKHSHTPDRPSGRENG